MSMAGSYFYPNSDKLLCFLACSSVCRLLPNTFHLQGNSNVIGVDPGFFQGGGGCKYKTTSSETSQAGDVQPQPPPGSAPD